MMPLRIRNIAISVFVIAWLCVFTYESTRHFILNPIVKKHFDVDLPKMKWLFPPAGWIMFYAVSPSDGYTNVYGIKGHTMEYIDPHDIIETDTLGYDNIHRGIMGAFFNQRLQACWFLKRKFPQYQDFAISQMYYPDVGKDRTNRQEQIVYRCSQ